jgi:hypothetical protein
MKLRSLVVGLAAGVLVFSANTAFAADPPAPVPATPVAAGPTLVTVLGTWITLSVGTDAAGHLTSVDLTSGGVAVAGAVATEVSPHAVEFVIGDGATHVEVKAKGKSVKTEVAASALADLVGTHTWSGELFGVGNGPTTVAFTIVDNGGVPSITGVTVGGLNSGSQIVTPSTDSGDDGSEAKVRIELTDGQGHDARITIKVEVEDHDGQAAAELKISARSDLFATVDAVGPVADPTVNVPVDPTSHEDDADHESDHADDSDHHDAAEQDDQHQGDEGRQSKGQESKGQESKGRGGHDAHDD